MNYDYENTPILSETSSDFNTFDKVLSSIKEFSYSNIISVSFLIIISFLVLFLLIFSFCFDSSKNEDFSQKKNGKKKKRSNKRIFKSNSTDALISDHYSINSEDYDNFLQYKKKMMKYQQMEAQNKKNRNNYNLIKFKYNNLDKKFEKMSKDQIQNLAKKENDFLIDVEEPNESLIKNEF